MTRHAGYSIPFEGQPDRETNRMCGAAALAMVYRSLPRPATPSAAQRAAAADARKDRRSRHAGPLDGVDRRKGSRRDTDVTQAQILPRITKPNRLGQPACVTHLMVKDALDRGYAAVAIQVTNPLQTLFACHARGIRTILNHRLKADGPAGHYTVLTGMDAESVVVHDPYFGPDHRIPFGDLLELWQPKYANSEIVGNMLIGVSTPGPEERKCRGCSVEIPPEVPCPRCAAKVPLSPASLLGCVGEACMLRSWSYLCCPACDFTWSFAVTPPEEERKPEEGLWNLGPFFAELDKLEAHVKSVKPAARRPDMQEQLAFIRESREKLRLAEREEMARRAQADAYLKDFTESVAKEEEAIAKAQEAAARPAAPIDAGKLGDALLKDLGIVKDR